jgi:DnaJ-class molecular chaperone
MPVQCPVCKGSKVIVPHNGVVQGKLEPKTCWMCNGAGEVIEQPTEKMIIKKYWNVEAENIV